MAAIQSAQTTARMQQPLGWTANSISHLAISTRPSVRPSFGRRPPPALARAWRCRTGGAPD